MGSWALCCTVQSSKLLDLAWQILRAVCLLNWHLQQGMRFRLTPDERQAVAGACLLPNGNAGTSWLVHEQHHARQEVLTMTGQSSAGKKKLKRLLTLGSGPRSHVKHFVVPERHATSGALCAVCRLNLLALVVADTVLHQGIAVTCMRMCAAGR